MQKLNATQEANGHNRNVVTSPIAAPLRVLRIEENQVVEIRTLADNYGGCFTHYTRFGSKVCLGKECNPLWHKSERVWKGYTPIEVWLSDKRVWMPWVLEITEALELDFRGVFKRGQVWTLFRHPPRGGKPSPVEGKLREERGSNNVPEIFDMRPPILAMYHVPSIDLSYTNPLPPRVFLQPSEGAGPAHLDAQEQDDKPMSQEEYLKLREQYNQRKQAPKPKTNGKH